MRQGPCHQGSYSCVNKSLDPRQCPQQFFPILLTSTLNGKHQLFPEFKLCPKPDLALNSQNMLTTPKEEGLRMSREQMASLWKSPNTESRKKLAQDCNQRQTREAVFTSTLKGLLKPSGVRTSQVVSLRSPNYAKGTAANVLKKQNVGTLVVNSQIKEKNTEKHKE